MITVTDKKLCTGCGACAAVCSLNAITLDEDHDGFNIPTVDTSLCVNCGKCDKVCPMLKDDHGIPEENKKYETRFFAGQLKDKDSLSKVSSGGAFWAFAEAVIKRGGAVYGAVQERVDQVYHSRAVTLEEAEKMCRSKYFQSTAHVCFKDVENDLKNGKTVLFSGTGCQIAAIISYLGKSYDGLYTCDVVCHGVPSKKAWRSYRAEAEAKKGKKITELVFRDKSQGWSNNQYKTTYDDGSVEYERSSTHPFHRGYLQGLFYRDSCGVCPYASLPRVSDVTLADYWKYRGRLAEGNMGTSLIATNTSKGEALLEEAAEYLEYDAASREDALSSCRHMDSCPKEAPRRRAFLKALDKKGYHKAIKSISHGTLIKRIIKRIKRMKG